MPYRDKLNGEFLDGTNVHKVFEYDIHTGILYRIMMSGSRKKVGTSKGDGHLVVTYGRKQYPITHIIWLILNGKLPDKNIEHKDLYGENNHVTNIREANQSQNMANIGVTARSRSGVKGVFWDKVRNKWGAYIGHNYKTYNLGRYDSVAEAKAAYDKKAKELFGEFARS